MIKEQMDKIYRDVPLDKIPWNVTDPPEALVKAIKENVPEQGNVIELGCGAGNYVIWFAGMGYKVTGIDISRNAIEIARRLAGKAGAICDFVVADATRDFPTFDPSFDFAYDWELLHHIFPEDREKYVDNVVRLLKPQGMYLSVCFSEESPQFGGVGKYRQTPLNTTLYFSTEEELRSLFARRLDIADLRTIDIRGKNVVHKAIYALMRKRSTGA